MNNSKIAVISFGQFEGKQIDQYILRNKKGMQVKIINYGATITSISIPNEEGQDIDLVCGFDTLEGYFGTAYQQNAPYFGCTVGRYASRIKDGKFAVDGQDYTLAVNNGSNHLHGGDEGFDKKVWAAEIAKLGESDGVQMSLESEHLEEGYPGKVSVKVTFLLSEDNALSIKYEGTTDKTTPLSLTNHTYFNLSGFSNTIEQHLATINAENILVPDPTNVPIGEIASVVGTVADLTDWRLLGDCFKELETGFEHYYLFDKPQNALNKVAEFKDSQSGRKLEIATTEPGALFYTGFFTSNDLQRENGDQYGKYRGLCFETSRYPNGPNISDSPYSLTHPGQVYKSETIFRITAETLT